MLRCLKVGMNPELVDASLRLKSLKSRKLQRNEQQPIMIDNLQPLENSGILSEVLRVHDRYDSSLFNIQHFSGYVK